MSYQAAEYTDVSEQERLVREHSDLVRRIAYHLIARLPQKTEVDDLIQSGMIGLLEAAKNYDPSRGASFATFAGIRIRGAMIDEVRRHDWTPRSVHKKQRQVQQAIAEIEAQTGQPATGRQVADLLGVSLDEYYKVLRDSAISKLFSLDEATDETTKQRRVLDNRSPTPDVALRQDQFRKELARAIDSLPEREKLVLSLYYEQELNLKEIGSVLEVSESRVCQIHGQALARLRSRMTI